MVSRRSRRMESVGAAVAETSASPTAGPDGDLPPAARRRNDLAALLLERPLLTLENSGLSLSAELAALQRQAIQTLWATTLATIELLKACRRATGQLAGTGPRDANADAAVGSAQNVLAKRGAGGTDTIGGGATLSVVSKAQTRKADVLARLPMLTRRQAEVLEWLLCGLANRDIAEKLGVSDTTVKAHVGEILRKLHVYNRTRLIAMLTRDDLPARAGRRR